jgi:cytoplasmic iron level regulating protein YaaA (DUF328/UPF0246 family)
LLVLLPPSETKNGGGEGPPLDLAQLAFAPALTRPRRVAVSAMVKLGRTPRTAARVLGLGPAQREEIDRNAQLRTAPTMPAIERYAGVLFDALDVASLDAAARTRASERIVIGSALLGAVRADDLIPAYRLSANSKVPALGSLVRHWKPALVPALRDATAGSLVVDLRSGGYRALAPVAGAATVRVLTEQPDGTRTVVSHFNKATKGLVARALVECRDAPTTVDDLAHVLAAAGHRVERSPDPLVLDVLTSSVVVATGQ